MYFVYELIDPRTDVTGYIGITNNPNKRYCEHIEGREGRGKKYDWIQHLQEQQIQPKMKILEIVDDLEQARKQERYWIQHYISNGIELKNATFCNKRCSSEKPTPRTIVYRPGSGVSGLAHPTIIRKGSGINGLAHPTKYKRA